MKRTQLLSSLLIGGLAVACILSLFALIKPGDVQAVSSGEVGRYQISSWASYAGGRVHHSGYYILDTVTGKVVDRGHEIHGIDKGSGASPK